MLLAMSTMLVVFFVLPLVIAAIAGVVYFLQRRSPGDEAELRQAAAADLRSGGRHRDLGPPPPMD